MKAFMLGLGLMFSTMTFAAQEVKLIENIYYSYPRIYSEFKINKELGRAWVETSVHTDFGDDAVPEVFRIKVEGLSYNAATSKIEILSNGRIVECASVRMVGRSIFKHERITETGDCKFSSKTFSVMVDDGFEVTKENRYSASMTIAD